MKMHAAAQICTLVGLFAACGRLDLGGFGAVTQGESHGVGGSTAAGASDPGGAGASQASGDEGGSDRAGQSALD